jgi:serpin B
MPDALWAWLPFEKASAELAFVLKVEMSEATTRRYAEGAGASYEAYQTAEVECLERETPSLKAGPKKMFFSVDGAMVALVGGEWVEVKTLTIGEIEAPVLEQGEWVVHSREHYYFSRNAEAKDFRRLALVETYQRGIEKAERVAALTDGAEWEQSLIDFHCPQAMRIQDFPHAAERVSQVGQSLSRQDTDLTKTWLGEQLYSLKHTGPEALLSDMVELVQGNNAFALALYQKLRGNETNLFFSPYSISLALAMTYAGVRGDTAIQMAKALHITLSQDHLHPAMNALDQEIAPDGDNVQANNNNNAGFRLNIANGIWGQAGFPFLPAYLDLLAQDYGGGMYQADFVHAADVSRKAINDWVAQQTQGKITNLFPQGALDDTTRLVLANAFYFKATWENSFDPAGTKNEPFYLLDGSQISVAMMDAKRQASYLYAESSHYQAVGLPYANSNVMMVVLMPLPGDFTELEAGLTALQLDGILYGMTHQSLNLSMPKFKLETVLDLKSTLISLGMPDAFDKNADFSGMDGKKDPYIADILHKAYVNVDENGTEAAAATGVVMGIMAMPAQPVISVSIDHPFLFLLYDSRTKTILFLGRVMNPGQ